MWKVKSKDSVVTVEVEYSSKGKEKGNYRNSYADGTVETGTYKPDAVVKIEWQLSRAALLVGGFLSGILIQAATHFLKLR